MHVLIISTSYPNQYNEIAGVFFKEQAVALAKNGLKVGVISIVPISIKSVVQQKKLNFGLVEYDENNVQTYVSTYLNIPKLPTYCVKKSLSKGKKIVADYIEKNGKPDIVHVHKYESVLLATYLKNECGIPFVITEHSSNFSYNKIPAQMEQYAKLAFEKSSCNIAVSEVFRAELSQKYKQDFHYIPNIVDTDFFSIKESKNDDFTFLNIAALNENKNHELLLKTFSFFQKEYPNSNLVIAGKGVLEGKLKSLSIELGIADKVNFIGSLSRKDVVSWMQKASIFVLTSKVETFGVVLIEAMSCGTPVLATKCGGPESIITSEELGELCEQNEADLLANMKKMYGNFNSYNTETIRKHAVDNFSSEVVCKKLKIVYNKVVYE